MDPSVNENVVPIAHEPSSAATEAPTEAPNEPSARIAPLSAYPPCRCGNPEHEHATGTTLDHLSWVAQDIKLDIEEDRMRGRTIGEAQAKAFLAATGTFSLRSAELREPPVLIDVPEAARLLGISEDALLKRKDRLQLPPGSVVQSGRRVQFHREKLLAGLLKRAR